MNKLDLPIVTARSLIARLPSPRFKDIDVPPHDVIEDLRECRSIGPKWAVDRRNPVLLDTLFQKEHHRLYTRGELVRLATTLNNPLNS